MEEWVLNNCVVVICLTKIYLPGQEFFKVVDDDFLKIFPKKKNGTETITENFKEQLKSFFQIIFKNFHLSSNIIIKYFLEDSSKYLQI